MHVVYNRILKIRAKKKKTNRFYPHQSIENLISFRCRKTQYRKYGKTCSEKKNNLYIIFKVEFADNKQ